LIKAEPDSAGEAVRVSAKPGVFVIIGRSRFAAGGLAESVLAADGGGGAFIDDLWSADGVKGERLQEK
jgi:hypothetical protein